MDSVNGIIVINKPQDWTSHDCVAVMRRLVGVKRIGHTGTLDPMATGVLPICIGTATRIMEYMDLDYKTYICTMKLGITTDTEDIWGEVISESKVENVTEEAIIKVLSEFKGEITQTPPKYSAVKVNGKKLYEYARAGQDVEIKSKKIWIEKIVLDFFNGDEIGFTVTCSKGTYVRTICKDIGEKLGCGAAMSSLERTASGIFAIEDSICIEKLKNMDRDEILKRLLKTDYPLVHFGKIKLDAKGAKDLVNGKVLPEKKIEKSVLSKYEEMYNVYYGEEFLGVAQMTNDGLKAHKIFNVRMQNENF